MIFILLIMLSLTEIDLSLKGVWVLDEGEISCEGFQETVVFTSFDQNCSFEEDVHVCREGYWTFLDSGRLEIKSVLRVPDQDTSYITLRYSNYSMEYDKLKICDTLDQNCIRMSYTLSNEGLSILDERECRSDLMFVPYEESQHGGF